MADRSSRCPTEAAHRSFLLGDLPQEEADAIAAHLESCADCELRSQRIDGAADPMVAALRSPSTQSLLPNGLKELRPAFNADAPRYVAGYEILEEVGRGGMGVVYKARQIRLNRLVALKMILAGPFARPEELVRFHVEGETLARLTHPSIVQIHEIGQADGRPFFSMEWVDGGNLADKLTGAAKLPDPIAAAIVEQIAGAVHFAHEHGIVHRDLKPANILIANAVSSSDATTALFLPPTSAEQFQLKVTDFGLAKPAWGGTALTVTGVVLGTPGYMAPEQARGDRHVGPPADVYSLGAILYELLTGRPPFPIPGTSEQDSQTPAIVIGQVLDRDPCPPRKLIPGLPRDLATICLRCLEKDPGSRYPTAKALAEDLRRFRNGEAVWARRSGELERVWKWAKRRPVVAGLLAAIAATVVLGTVVSTYFAFEASHQSKIASAARVRAELSRNESQRELARADFQEGRRLAELGRVGDGMHWMLTALRQLPDAEADRPFRELIRRNLTAWSSRLHQLRHCKVSGDEIYAMAFSPDCRLFAVGGHDRTVRIFNADTGQETVPAFATGSRVRAMAFSPDSKYLIAGGDAGYQQGEHSRVTRWDVATGREFHSPVDLPADLLATSIAYSEDGLTFAVAGSVIGQAGQIGVWVCRSDSGAQVIQMPARLGTCVVGSRSGGPGFLTMAYDDSGPIEVAAFDGVKPGEWKKIEPSRGPTKLAFHPGNRLLVCDSAGIRA